MFITPVYNYKSCILVKIMYNKLGFKTLILLVGTRGPKYMLGLGLDRGGSIVRGLFGCIYVEKTPLNSVVLVAPTHKEPVRVSGGTTTQAVAWTIDKWRIEIIQREIYNVRNP